MIEDFLFGSLNPDYFYLFEKYGPPQGASSGTTLASGMITPHVYRGIRLVGFRTPPPLIPPIYWCRSVLVKNPSQIDDLSNSPDPSGYMACHR
jgi:hypothetical protein